MRSPPPSLNTDQDLKVFVFGAFDDVVLQLTGDVAEVRAVTGDTNQQVAVVIRFLLSLEKGLTVHDVKLDMPQLQGTPGSDERHDLLGSGLAGHALRGELDVEQTGGTVNQIVVLGMIVGEQNGCGAVGIGAMGSGGTVGKSGPCVTAVRGGGNNLAEGHVRGNRHITHIAVDIAFLAALDGFDLAGAIHVPGDAVGVRIVIAVAGSVLEHGADGLTALEVTAAGIDHLLHGQLLLIEHKLLNGRQGIDNGAVAEEFEVGEINAAGDLLSVQVEHILHAEVM